MLCSVAQCLQFPAGLGKIWSTPCWLVEPLLGLCHMHSTLCHQTMLGSMSALQKSMLDQRQSGYLNHGPPRVKMKKRCNGKDKVLCDRMDIRPRTGLFGQNPSSQFLLFCSPEP